MAARELRPWSTTDTALAKRDRGDFSAYPVPSDIPDPKVIPARESAASSDSPTPSAVTSANPANAEKESSSTLAPPTNLPPL